MQSPYAELDDFADGPANTDQSVIDGDEAGGEPADSPWNDLREPEPHDEHHPYYTDNEHFFASDAPSDPFGAEQHPPEPPPRSRNSVVEEDAAGDEGEDKTGQEPDPLEVYEAESAAEREPLEADSEPGLYTGYAAQDALLESNQEDQEDQDDQQDDFTQEQASETEY